MTKIRIDSVLKKAKAFEKAGQIEQARSQYQLILDSYPQNSRAQKGLAALPGMEPSQSQSPFHDQALLQSQLVQLDALLRKQKYSQTIKLAQETLKRFPDSFWAWNFLGGAHFSLRQLDPAAEAFRKVTELNPRFPEAFNNLGAVYLLQEKLDEAIEVLRSALALKPDYPEAWGNLGRALQKNEQLDEASTAFRQALSLAPGDPKTLTSLSVILKAQGRTDEAVQALKLALSLAPADAKAHFGLSSLVKYDESNPQIAQVRDLLGRPALSDTDRYYLHFSLAKMLEDIGDLKNAVEHYRTGGALKQKVLNYQFSTDEALFGSIKSAAPAIITHALEEEPDTMPVKPIFILGMPRSGTTLVEQILSSHSEICGAGELSLLESYGSDISFGKREPSKAALKEVRQTYLRELEKLSEGRPYVTDKMPMNFYQVGLIRSVLPEARIIHTMRDPAATCWSNFKILFASEGLGYSYDLRTVTQYYRLYQNLMVFWREMFGNSLYDLDYDQLTMDQEGETRKLINYVGVDWQDACLAPHKNDRSVNTASQVQVRQAVYKNSSQSWRKFEPFLDGAFDGLVES